MTDESTKPDLTSEEIRLQENKKRTKYWKHWGPYLGERQWATVREDYSHDGDAWSDFPFEHSRSRTYRWGEDGLAGVADTNQLICLSMSLWNEQDDILKDFEADKVDFNVPKSTATSAYFFQLLREAILDGVYSDPIYRGNRDMAGWKMKQFPGHQHSYLDVIESDEFQDIDPLPNFG